MSTHRIAILPERGAVSVAGPDSQKLLSGLITNDIAAAGPRRAIFAGLLSPQGKILFEFFVTGSPDGYLLDVSRPHADDLVKRLSMYRLRADVSISNVSSRYRTATASQLGEQWRTAFDEAVAYIDPRTPELGVRALLHASTPIGDGAVTPEPAGAYHAHRIACGVPEGGLDFAFGDAFPHEANYDRFNGASFTKGCYVGQEIVARMQNKSVIRKRVTKLEGAAPLRTGDDILAGDVAIGRVGSTAGRSALGMLRLDRAVEAQEKAVSLTAGGIVVTPDQVILDRYVSSLSERGPVRGGDAS